MKSDIHIWKQTTTRDWQPWLRALLRIHIAHDSFVCMQWLLYLCAMTPVFLCHDSFYVGAMTNPYVCHVVFIHLLRAVTPRYSLNWDGTFTKVNRTWVPQHPRNTHTHTQWTPRYRFLLGWRIYKVNGSGLSQRHHPTYTHTHNGLPGTDFHWDGAFTKSTVVGFPNMLTLHTHTHTHMDSQVRISIGMGRLQSQQ